MQIWIHWWNVVRELRPACSRTRSFLWLAATLAGLCIRSDLLGVTSIVRALGLREGCYDRLLDFFHSAYFVGDAYYACHAVVFGIIRIGGHLVTKVKFNAVAYAEAAKGSKRRRGRPKFYGKKTRLASLFADTGQMIGVQSPVYGEEGVTIFYRCLDLVWKPLAGVVRFVAVSHPARGRCLLMCTDLTLDPVDIIRLYGIRFKIEVSFKTALRVVGVYAYHFWMGAMKPIKRCSGDQYLHRATDKYRQAIRRKLAAYHRYIQIGLIAQGLLQYLSAAFPLLVWRSFGSWLRTIRPGIPPSEMVAAQALRMSLPEFLCGFMVKRAPWTEPAG